MFLVLRFTKLDSQWKANKNLNENLAFQPLSPPIFPILNEGVECKENVKQQVYYSYCLIFLPRSTSHQF